MSKCSNKSIAKTLLPTNLSLLDMKDNDKHLALLERKIALATEGFTTHKLCDVILKDRDRTSEENADHRLPSSYNIVVFLDLRCSVFTFLFKLALTNLFSCHFLH